MGGIVPRRYRVVTFDKPRANTRGTSLKCQVVVHGGVTLSFLLPDPHLDLGALISTMDMRGWGMYMLNPVITNVLPQAPITGGVAVVFWVSIFKKRVQDHSYLSHS